MKKKMNRFKVLLFRPQTCGNGYIMQVCGAYKSVKAAEKHANKINAKHCIGTSHIRPKAWVEITKSGVGIIQVLEPVYRPSVSELIRDKGYAIIP